MTECNDSKTLPRSTTSQRHLDRIARTTGLELPKGYGPGYSRDGIGRWCREAVESLGPVRAIESVGLEAVSTQRKSIARSRRDRDPPEVVGGPSHAFSTLGDGGSAESADMVFHRLHDVRIALLGALGPVVLDSEGRVVEELSTLYAPLAAIYEIDLSSNEVVTEHREGPCVALLDRFWEANYAHWLLDGMSRLLAAELYGLERFDVLTTEVRRPWQREMLAGFGIGPERHIDIGIADVIAFDDLIVSDQLGSRVAHPACRAHARAMTFIASAASASVPEGVAGAPAAATDEVLLVVRSDNRRLDNGDRLVAALLAAGFCVTLVDCAKVPVATQWRLFSRAPIVVGVHGAALANAAFMRAGSTLVELMPPTYGNPEFWMIARARDVGYVCIAGLREVDPELRPQIRSVALTDEGMDATVAACERARRAGERIAP